MPVEMLGQEPWHFLFESGKRLIWFVDFLKCEVCFLLQTNSNFNHPASSMPNVPGSCTPRYGFCMSWSLLPPPFFFLTIWLFLWPFLDQHLPKKDMGPAFFSSLDGAYAECSRSGNRGTRAFPSENPPVTRGIWKTSPLLRGESNDGFIRGRDPTGPQNPKKLYQPTGNVAARCSHLYCQPEFFRWFLEWISHFLSQHFVSLLLEIVYKCF